MLKSFCIRQSKNLHDTQGFMICLRKHHQSRVIAESIDSMNISHSELISDLLIAFWERSRSMLRISTKAGWSHKIG